MTPSTSTSDTKIDNLVKVMERMLEKINLNDRMPPREPQNNQNRNRNQNYRRENNQDKQNENDQQLELPSNKTMWINMRKIGRWKGWEKLM